MPRRNMNNPDPLGDFDSRSITLDCVTKVLNIARGEPITEHQRTKRDEVLAFFAQRLSS